MVFSSLLFLFLFLPVVLAVYLLLPGLRARNAWLLLVSLVFYAWGEIGFILLLLISTLVNFALGKWVERCEKVSERKLAVAVAVVVNVGFLAYFKYAGLVVASLNLLLKPLGFAALPVPHIALPIGISFFTFHALSYVIDIYRRKWRAARDPRDTALYIFFFPQLVAGPILRWNAIAPQLESRSVTRAMLAEGARRFVGGLAKKMIVANAVAVPADQIFALPPSQLSTPVAWLGIVCYTIQIYFDFSGYSDMAVGMGKMFGFQFIENFQFPYISQSIREFWRRWHISLSTWFRDYVYIPLGGNRVSTARNHLNLVAVFLLCGLWHGASWTFVAWGLCHGIFLVLERTAWGTLLDKFPRPLRHLYALFVVMMCWVLFRADTFSAAAHYFSALFGAGQVTQAQPLQRYADREVIWALCLGTAFSLPLWDAIKNTGEKLSRFLPEKALPVYFGAGQLIEIVLVLALLLISSAWLAGGTYNPFIYFRF
ncbi:MAG TPA: MBOAT family protein [Verrucomicrobiae bacterium]|jgi:alginate O-acetyltransferase complex protein AlgI|nr:MBOAT family protein [Verrucomicrobiae bacterium]